MDGKKPSYSKIDRKNPRLPARKAQELDKNYLERNPDYKPGVWMRNASSLSNMDNRQENAAISKETQDRIINEEIERYINDYNREKKESMRDVKDRINNDIRQREMLLEDLKRRDEQQAAAMRETSKKQDIDEEKRKIEKIYQKMLEDDLEKQRQMQRERQKMNELIKRRIEEQDRLLALERREIEDRNKRLLDEERLKNEIERNKLRELKKQREELLKQELNELTQIEKHEKKKILIEEELKRSIRAREAEKQRFSELNKKIEELRQREIEELARIKSDEKEVTRRRKELMDDAFINRIRDDDVIEVWPCGKRDSKMCIVDPNDLCVDPFSGKLVIRADVIPVKENRMPKNEAKQAATDVNKSFISNRTRDKLLTKQKYLELLSTYDPKKLRRKLSYQNWLINDSTLDDRQVAEKFPGSDFSLKIDMNDWPAIKQESIKRYAVLKGK